jgi:hypothetical protein
MIRTMLDTDRPDQLTVGADIIISYADLWSQPIEDHLRALAKAVAWIDRGQGDPNGIASIIDIEPGTFAPGRVAGWLDRKAGQRVPYLTTYCDRAEAAAVAADAGSRVHWRIIATLDGTVMDPEWPWTDRPAATQCIAAAALGFHADLSLVLRDGWHPTR